MGLWKPSAWNFLRACFCQGHHPSRSSKWFGRNIARPPTPSSATPDFLSPQPPHLRTPMPVPKYTTSSLQGAHTMSGDQHILIHWKALIVDLKLKDHLGGLLKISVSNPTIQSLIEVCGRAWESAFLKHPSGFLCWASRGRHWRNTA